MIMLNNIPVVEHNHCFNDEFDYILCTKYGDDGLIPTRNCCGNSCISSSGTSICGSCHEWEEIPNTNLSVVKCGRHYNCFKESE